MPNNKQSFADILKNISDAIVASAPANSQSQTKSPWLQPEQIQGSIVPEALKNMGSWPGALNRMNDNRIDAMFNQIDNWKNKYGNNEPGNKGYYWQNDLDDYASDLPDSWLGGSMVGGSFDRAFDVDRALDEWNKGRYWWQNNLKDHVSNLLPNSWLDELAQSGYYNPNVPHVKNNEVLDMRIQDKLGERTWKPNPSLGQRIWKR